MVQGLTRRERLIESLWRLVGQPLMRLTFHNWYGGRRVLLRMFGATLHDTSRIRPSARISHPWNLSVGAHTTIGDHAILFCLGPITIGDRCTISQYAHLCAAGHDYTRREMPLIMKPITIEDDAWIAADVFVGPGVTVGRDTVVGARSTVLKSLPAARICRGDKAVPIAQREIRWPPPRTMPLSSEAQPV
jgi:putative colanic acid biosynthesis acetyltransferase WcaF